MSSFRKHVGWVGVAGLLAAVQLLVLACGDDETAVRRSLTLRVYNSDSGQSQGFPPVIEPQVFEVRVRVYQNGQERQDLYPTDASGLVFPYDPPSGQLPQLEFGENYQLIVEGLNRDGNVLADGATPVFDFFDETETREIQVFVSPLYSVEYVSALYVTDGGLVSVPSEFEGPFVAGQLGLGAEDLGGQRAGHTLTELPDGRIVAIGGARLTSSGGIGGSPFARFIDTVEIFDPANGYWTLVRDLDAVPVLTPSGDEVSAPMQLSVPRAFHSATALGDGQILVAGGFWDNAGQIDTSNAAEIIDLNKGTIQVLEPGVFDLLQPRALHTAHLIGGQVYLFGGVSRTYGNPSFLPGVEVFRPEDGFFERAIDAGDGGNLELLVARGLHESVQLADGVLVIGGRTQDGVTPTMEFFENSGDGGLSRYFDDAGTLPALQTARFGHEALLMARDFENSSAEEPLMYIAVAGGYMAPDTTAGDLLRGTGLSDTVEFVNERDFTTNPANNVTMEQPRAHFAMVETSITRDLLIMGGIGANGVSREVERHVRSIDGGFPLTPSTTLNPQGGGADELHLPRAFPSVVQLGTHNVMVVGGWDGTAGASVCGSSSLTAGCTAELANPGDLFVLGWLY